MVVGGGYRGGYGGYGGYGRPWSAPVTVGPRLSIGVGVGGGGGYYRPGGYYRGGGWGWRGGPRIGVYVPLLPSLYSTWYYGGSPYYYADGAYYAPATGGGYTVVSPPPGADLVAGTAPAPQGPPDPVIYPRNNQTAVQTEADRRDCNRWATEQPNAVADASVFQRSVEACMDARGYSVR